MTQMEVLALIIGGIGAVVGVIALVYAHAAFRGGKDATKLAAEANHLAKDPNSVAHDARRIAMEANGYSHRAEQRETKRHDVYWEGDWVEPGTYLLIKRGDDPAHNAKATVSYEGNEVSQSAAVIEEDGTGFEFVFPAAVADFEREVAERAEPKSLPFGIPDVEYPKYHSTTERVEWTTPRGRPKLHAPQAFNLVSFSGFYPD